MSGDAEPAPVARFEAIGADEPEPAPVARFDEVPERVPGPVAEFGAPDREQEGAGSDAPVAALAELIEGAEARPELSRVVRLSELGGRRSAHGGAAGVPRPPRPAVVPEIADPRLREERQAARAARQTARRRRAGLPAPEREQGEPGLNEGAPAAPTFADPVAAAKEICLRLLTDRARTRQELAQALRRKGIPEDAAAQVLERFDEVGLIDDAAFAGQWVRSRHNHKGLARRAIAMELRRKGVDDEIAGEALAEVDSASEEERAGELVARKLRSLPVGTPEQRASATRRLVGMLARKGYSAGIAYRVVKEALTERGVELESEETEFDAGLSD